MAYPVAIDEFGHAPTGLLTKRDRMRFATLGFDAEGAARAGRSLVGPGIYAVAVRLINTATGEAGLRVPVAVVVVT